MADPTLRPHPYRKAGEFLAQQWADHEQPTTYQVERALLVIDAVTTSLLMAGFTVVPLPKVTKAKKARK